MNWNAPKKTSRRKKRCSAWNSRLFTRICSRPNCYVWPERILVYPCVQLWLHTLTPLGWLHPVWRHSFSFCQLKKPPNTTVTVGPVITNKPHLSWTTILKPSQNNSSALRLWKSWDGSTSDRLKLEKMTPLNYISPFLPPCLFCRRLDGQDLMDKLVLCASGGCH